MTSGGPGPTSVHRFFQSDIRARQSPQPASGIAGYPGERDVLSGCVVAIASTARMSAWTNRAHWAVRSDGSKNVRPGADSGLPPCTVDGRSRRHCCSGGADIGCRGCPIGHRRRELTKLVRPLPARPCGSAVAGERVGRASRRGRGRSASCRARRGCRRGPGDFPGTLA